MSVAELPLDDGENRPQPELPGVHVDDPEFGPLHDQRICVTVLSALPVMRSVGDHGRLVARMSCSKPFTWSCVAGCGFDPPEPVEGWLDGA